MRDSLTNLAGNRAASMLVALSLSVLLLSACTFEADSPEASAVPQDRNRVEATSINGTPRPEVCAVATTENGTLAEAKAIYADICEGYPQPDCDPAYGGGFQCASAQIGNNAPSWVVDRQPVILGGPVSGPAPAPAPVPVPVPTPAPEPAPTPVVGTPDSGRVWNPNPVSWKDSVAVNGTCYIDSNFDHGIGDVTVDTPAGPRTVRQIADDQGPIPAGNRIPYNDVQCGNGPPNNAGDEDPGECPGRVDQGNAGCDVIGPTWDLAAIYNAPVNNPNPNLPSTIRIQAESDSATGWVNAGTYLYWGLDNFYPRPPTTDALTYQFQVPEDGVYQMRLRARADRQTPGRNDLHNDAWIKMDGDPVAGVEDVRDYVKVFSSGSGDWTLGGNTDVGGSHGPFQQYLRAGATYQLSVKGRSDFYAIDYFELSPVGGTTVSSSGDLPPLLDSSAYLHTFNDPYVPGDLMSMHYDMSMDPDDMQASILAKHILDERTDVDYIIVTGTKHRFNQRVINGSHDFLEDLWGINVIDAFADNCDRNGIMEYCQEAIDETADYWMSFLQQGNRVHVAEGGPSGFTADVIRELRSRGINDNLLKNIRVIQHSWGWNEEHTDTGDLNVVRQYADYIRIADGNASGDHAATSDFNQSGSTAGDQFRTLALSSTYRDMWARAWTYTDKEDASDAVEVMWILGIPKATAPTLLAFAARYF